MLKEVAASWGIELNIYQLDQYEHYAQELALWNRQHNLISRSDSHELIARHVLDSLSCALGWSKPPQRLIDIGSGAGFPGLALKIAFPAIELTLVESIEKKTAFLHHMSSQLDLERVTILSARVETLGQSSEHRERYDIATARAVAELAVLAEYCLPLLSIGGRLLAPKGLHIEDELANAQNAISTLGGNVLHSERISIPGQPDRSLIVIEKIQATPASYPRRVGLPARKPLR